MLPQVSTLPSSLDNITVEAYPSKSYKLFETQINGYVDGLSAIQQAIYHILSTERYAYVIYNDNYGAELEQYIGESFSFLEATISKTLRDALLQDDRILDIIIVSVEQTSLNSALVIFTVYTREGDLEVGLNINV